MQRENQRCVIGIFSTQLQLQLLKKKISNYDYFSITVIVIEITVIAITLGSIIHLWGKRRVFCTQKYAKNVSSIYFILSEQFFEIFENTPFDSSVN